MNRIHKILKYDIIKGKDNCGKIHEGTIWEIRKNGIILYTGDTLVFIKYSNILEAWNEGKTCKYKFK